jgi:hypothetical protein
VSGKEATAKQDRGPTPQIPAEAGQELAPQESDSATAARMTRTSLGGPPPLSPPQVLALQRSLGNRATMALLPPGILQRQVRTTAARAETAEVDARSSPRDPALPETAVESVQAQASPLADPLPRQEQLENREEEREEPIQTRPAGRQTLHVHPGLQPDTRPGPVTRPAVQQRSVQRAPETHARQDVVVIVGRPSFTIERKETRQDKEDMEAWRAAAAALSSTVFEGLTVDKAFAGLKKLKTPIGKLYIICHSGREGVAEIDPDGTLRSTTVADLTRRIKRAAGQLENRAPQSIEMLSCSVGGSVKTMGQIGGALGAATVRAPKGMTVITGRSITVDGKRLTKARIRKLRLKDGALSSYIQQTDALKYYDFVPGVPHPDPAPSRADKMKHLVAVLRKTGMIPFVAFNAAPGDRDAVPYWNASVERRSLTEKLGDPEEVDRLVPRQGVIEVDVRP